MNTDGRDATRLRIQTPCDKSWDELRGDGTKRYCASCDLYVVDLASMSEAEGVAWFEDTRARGDRACAMMTRTTGGEYVARAEPVPRARVLALGRTAAAFLMGVFATLGVGCHGDPEDVAASAGGATDPDDVGSEGSGGAGGEIDGCGDGGAPDVDQLRVLGGIEMGRVTSGAEVLGEVEFEGGGEQLIGGPTFDVFGTSSDGPVGDGGGAIDD